MTSNRVSKPTPMLRCAQIKGAPWLEISKIGTAPSCLWIAGGGGGGPWAGFLWGWHGSEQPPRGSGLAARVRSTWQGLWTGSLPWAPFW